MAHNTVSRLPISVKRHHYLTLSMMILTKIIYQNNYNKTN